MRASRTHPISACRTESGRASGCVFDLTRDKRLTKGARKYFRPHCQACEGGARAFMVPISFLRNGHKKAARDFHGRLGCTYEEIAQMVTAETRFKREYPARYPAHPMSWPAGVRATQVRRGASVEERYGANPSALQRANWVARTPAGHDRVVIANTPKRVASPTFRTELSPTRHVRSVNGLYATSQRCPSGSAK